MPSLTVLLFWIAAVTMVIGQIVLVRAAWRLRNQQTAADPQIPRSNVQADLGWTIATAMLTAVLFVMAYPLVIGR